MKPAPLSYSRPEALSGVLDALRQSSGDARVIAGGQSLGPMLNFRLAQPRQLVDISRIDALPRTPVPGMPRHNPLRTIRHSFRQLQHAPDANGGHQAAVLDSSLQAPAIELGDVIAKLPGLSTNGEGAFNVDWA